MSELHPLTRSGPALRSEPAARNARGHPRRDRHHPSAGLSNGSEISLVVLYVVTATFLVWVPVLLNLVFQRRTTDWLSTVEASIRAAGSP